MNLGLKSNILGSCTATFVMIPTSNRIYSWVSLDHSSHIKEKGRRKKRVDIESEKRKKKKEHESPHRPRVSMHACLPLPDIPSPNPQSCVTSYRPYRTNPPKRVEKLSFPPVCHVVAAYRWQIVLLSQNNAQAFSLTTTASPSTPSSSSSSSTIMHQGCSSTAWIPMRLSTSRSSILRIKSMHSSLGTQGTRRS